MFVRVRLPVRVHAALFGAWGAVLLVRPELIRRSLCPEFPVSRRWVARLLGGRTLVQSAVLLAHPDRRWLLVGAGVDAVHAASMLAVLPARAYRRAALLSGGVAAASAALAAATEERLGTSERAEGSMRVSLLSRRSSGAPARSRR